MESLNYLWKQVDTYKIDSAHSMIGSSIGAKGTCMYSPENGFMYDCGNSFDFSPLVVFITHGHMDHCKHMHDAMVDPGTVRPIIVVPEEIYDRVHKFIHAQFELSTQNSNPKVFNKIEIMAVKSNYRYPITVKNKRWMIDIVKCFHSVPTVGYGVSECRTRLLPKYAHLEKSQFSDLKKELNDLCKLRTVVYSKEFYDQINHIATTYNIIIALEDFIPNKHGGMCVKKSYAHIEKNRISDVQKDMKILYNLYEQYEFVYGEGFHAQKALVCDKFNIELDTSDFILDARGNVRIDENYEKPILCFLGDTSPRAFENKILDKFPTIFTECTFLEDTPKCLKHAKETFHMHWKYLEPIIRARPEQKFVLFHFSAKYRSDHIRDFFADYLNPDHPKYMGNIHPWVKSTSACATECNCKPSTSNQSFPSMNEMEYCLPTNA